jgi:hypothetical protein
MSNALEGEEIGLEEVGDEIWAIVYYNTILGRIDLETGKITGNDKVQTMCPDFCQPSARPFRSLGIRQLRPQGSYAVCADC